MGEYHGDVERRMAARAFLSGDDPRYFLYYFDLCGNVMRANRAMHDFRYAGIVGDFNWAWHGVWSQPPIVKTHDSVQRF